MNHIYRSIWDEQTGTVVAVAETVSGRGKKSSSGAGAVVGSGFILKTIAIAVGLACGAVAHASPVGGTVVAGSASITSTETDTTIDQASQNASLNWQSFDIGIGESVRFVQPNSSSVALNRVLGSDATHVLGSLSANGHVFLINPNGLVFGTGAQVNVGGLVASTRNITDSDFMVGRYSFNGTSDATVLNQGSINADGGYVALLGANVSNQGVIAAKLGSVSLAAGNAFTLDVAGDGLLNVAVSEGAVNALARNGGLIQADGGQVLLTAHSAGNLLQSVVNNTGLIQAQTIENHNGVIKLLGDMQSGTVSAGGTLDASAPNGGSGGFVETSAAHVQIASNAIVTTAAAPQGVSGTWLIDPVDFTIAATGGDMTGDFLSTSLGLGNVEIQSGSGASGVDGDIHVNDLVTWSANQLTLEAFRNININTSMDGSGTASLALLYGQGAIAADNTATVNVRAPVNLPTGNNFSTTLGSDGVVKTYAVINSMAALQAMNSNLSGDYALGSNLDATGFTGFVPIGPITSYDDVANRFSGSFDGLGHTIDRLTINRPANNYVGLFGSLDGTGSVRNIGVTNVSVTGYYEVGGIVAFNFGAVSNSYASGAVSGQSDVGGLVGYQRGGTVDNSYANVAVTSSLSEFLGTAGGLVADNEGGYIRNSYATGAVSGEGVGGLLGTNRGGTVINSYSTGLVTTNGSAGGLIARELFSATVTNSFWNVTTSGQSASAGGTGLSTVELQAALPAGFSSAIWGNGGNRTTPYLLNNPGFVLIDADTSTTYYKPILNIDQLQAINLNLAGNYALVNDIDAGATSNWNSGAGFVPLGNDSTKFTGVFNGLGYTIGNLTIDRPTTDYVGLFGSTSAAQIHNTGLLDADITGRDHVGALAGATVIGAATKNYATGQVSGRSNVGGLIGYSNTTVLTSSYTTTTVAGENDVGGLIGRTNGGQTASLNYATGNVTGTANVGGLVGQNGFAAVIADSYATGAVNGLDAVGGLVGYLNNGEVSRSYSIGSVSGSGVTGGLVGVSTGTVNSSFWNTTTSGQAASAGGTGKTTAEMNQQASFSGWNFNSNWITYEGYSNPLLRTFMTALTVNVDSVTRTYDGTAFSGGTATYSVAPDSNLLGSLSYSGTAQGATNAGNYSLTASGLYSNQQGYIITYANGSLTVNPATLTATVTATDKMYDGNTDASVTLGTLSGLVGSETLGLNATASFNSKDVATANLVTVDNVTLADGTNGGLASNYTLAAGQTASASITARELTATATATDKVYDGSTTASVSLSGLTGFVGAETVNASGTGAFNSKDVATANLVTVDSVTLSDGGNGGLASNYWLASGQTTSASITPKALTVIGETALDKVYDGTTTATLTGGSLTGLVAGESVELIEAGEFATASVGSGIAVTATNTLRGAAAANYALTQPTGLTAAIAAAVPPPPPMPDVGYVSALGHVSATAMSSSPSGDSGNSFSSLPPTASVSPTSTSLVTGLNGLNLTVIENGINRPQDVEFDAHTDTER